MRRPLLIGLALVMVVLVSGCTSSNQDDVAEDGNDAPVAPAVVDLDVIQQEVDEIVVMQSGGFAAAPPFPGPEMQVLDSRHVLRAKTPNGSADLFELVIDEPGQFGGIQQCSAVVQGDGTSMSCGPIDQEVGRGGQPDEMIPGAFEDQEVTILELVGPPGTTHFIAVVDKKTIGVVAVEGQALLVSAGSMCQATPRWIEAWNRDELLQTQEDPGFC